MLKNYSLAIILVCSILPAFSQTDTIKVLEERLANATNDSIRINVLSDLHNACFVSNPDKSYYYAQQILETGKKINSAKYIARGYRGLARCERKKRNYHTIFRYDSLALKYAILYGDLETIYSQQILFVHDYLDAEKYADAYKWITITEATVKALNAPAAFAELNKTTGYYYRETNQHKKAVPYYYKAIATLQAINDEKNIAETKLFLAQSYMALGKTDSTANLLFDALTIYTKRNSLGRMGMINELLGDALLANGDVDKGIEHYLEAKRLYAISNNFVDEGLCLPYLARAYMAKKDYATAKRYMDSAQALFSTTDYELGKINMQTILGQYYSETGEPVKAESFFINASNMLAGKNYPELKTANEKYWSQHKYRIKQFKAADSLLYIYTAREANSKEPEVLAGALNAIKEKNKSLDTNSLKILSLLYTPGGAELLKKNLKNQSLADVLHTDSLLNLDPDSYAYDSTLTTTYNKQILDLEVKYNTKQKDDSLHIANQNILLAKSELQNKNLLLIAAAIVALLLSGAFWQQYKNRQRAERDKAKIQLLQNEIHHRVKNNLGIIKRFVDVAKQSGKANLSLDSLQSRITAIELLHKNLYQLEKAGEISLQAYLEQLVNIISSTFYEENKNIQISVHTPVTTDMQTAEKLGLIVNELITNSYKYGFRNIPNGEIKITTSNADSDKFTLHVEENGIGYNKEKTAKGYGSKLIEGIAHELNAVFNMNTANGVSFNITV